MKVGFAGLTHGHVWGLIDRFAEAGADLAAVADPTPLMEQARPRFRASYAEWREMLASETLDALVVTSDSLESAEIAVRALGQGIPCLVEKPMAASAADAERMLSAWRASGKTLMINWPIAWSGWPHELARRVMDASLGHVFHFRFRTGHHGPKEIGCDPYFVGWLYDERKNGGGAIGDFCCYGAVLARWMFGMPEQVYCVRGNYTKDYEVADDHAVLTLRYPKMSAILEGTWATYGFDDGANPVVHAKNGTLGVYGERIARFEAGKVPESFDAPRPEVVNPAAYFINCIGADSVPEGILHPEIAAGAARIVDAGLRSSRSGCAEAP